MTTRKDKIKNQAKVIKEITKDPSLTEREVAKKVGISNGSAHNHMKEVEQNGAESKILDKILGDDEEIIKLVNRETLKKIKEMIEDDKVQTMVDLKNLGDLGNNSTKRLAIFRKDKDTGNNTIKFIIT